jgi:hypothetical protein
MKTKTFKLNKTDSRLRGRAMLKETSMIHLMQYCSLPQEFLRQLLASADELTRFRHSDSCSCARCFQRLQDWQMPFIAAQLANGA